ncbi:monooxygenase [Rhizobium lentis]|uniref:Alkylation response protein AidB-like acyl-CoA dehydrogenase n=1 Tax=Rhizobium lentis TaxID=1138194 RepID=A0A7W8UMH6_9HYPH|nr:monooxygenase [Rhizobium lentis]MBB4571842.1 alkylation response protein AidB-like acyl-CoA dehydrogenase [Rhizobium lentis]MBB5548967.1 alkylation response protein AidB-like acyl-CoA dehydrogenase [Rhizobium lentis]MBB5559500.1 alkylation response protein AidB-like acyl-CoA dehydrogenase [Rhizobium lentis]MBB5564978.1 alkylation response protein AidB-like acyl-CoA dehydrogenase [Rhizobium lentis]
MGTISQFRDRLRPPAQRIESEEAAISTARDLATAFRREASERDINRILPFAEVDALSMSGLTAITVPPDHEGLDVPNALLAEIVAIIAEADASIGETLESHFSALETLRIQAGEDLKTSLFARVLLGDRFAAAAFAEGCEVTDDGPGYRLSGRTRQAAGILYADWIAAALTLPPDRPATFYLTGSDGDLQVVDDWDGFGQRTNGSATAIAGPLHVNADAIVPAPSLGYSTGVSLGLLLKAGVSLGIARAAWADLMKAIGDRAAVLSQLGKHAVGIEATAAALERAGRKLDFAQVNPVEAAMADAYFSASAAAIIAGDTALATANALFELAGQASAGIGLNLDRHWRNARIHALSLPRDRLLRSAGKYVSQKVEN